MSKVRGHDVYSLLGIHLRSKTVGSDYEEDRSNHYAYLTAVTISLVMFLVLFFSFSFCFVSI